MKTKHSLLVIPFVLFYAFIAVAFYKEPNLDYNGAKAEQEQGFFIFSHSKPVSEYEYLGTVKVNVTMSGSPKELFNKALKKARKEYPQGDGIIFNAELDKVDVIKFK